MTQTELLEATGAFLGVGGAKSEVKVNISIAPASLAETPALVTRLKTIINAAYAYEVGVFWDAEKWERTNSDEVRQVIRAGELAVAWLEGSAQSEPDALVGCVYMKLADPKTGGFGMLACDARYQGAGIGRDLLQYAEDWAKRDGAEVMQLELLYPDGWENKGKDWLAKWYERAGYSLARVEEVEGLLGRMAHLLIQPTVLRIYRKTL
jgi:GNAT superfamily N-acetyltransferase